MVDRVIRLPRNRRACLECLPVAAVGAAAATDTGQAIATLANGKTCRIARIVE